MSLQQHSVNLGSYQKLAASSSAETKKLITCFKAFKQSGKLPICMSLVRCIFDALGLPECALWAPCAVVLPLLSWHLCNSSHDSVFLLCWLPPHLPMDAVRGSQFLLLPHGVAVLVLPGKVNAIDAGASLAALGYLLDLQEIQCVWRGAVQLDERPDAFDNHGFLIYLFFQNLITNIYFFVVVVTW